MVLKLKSIWSGLPKMVVRICGPNFLERFAHAVVNRHRHGPARLAPFYADAPLLQINVDAPECYKVAQRKAGEKRGANHPLPERASLVV